MTTTAIKERPILFSGPMVRAILDGRKTQTRRPIKPQPEKFDTPPYWRWESPTFRRLGPFAVASGDCPGPFGFWEVDDLLWVRETWALAWPWVDPDTGSADDFGLWCGPLPKEKPTFGWRIFYGADGDDFASHPHDRHIKKYHPSIHMPRWASRITLRVKRVWVERVQDISEEDARAEGMDPSGPVGNISVALKMKPSRYQFANLWESVYPESWDANDWVWACEFERVKP